MSPNKKRPDFYEETVLNREEPVVASNIQTKILTQRETVNIANPNEMVDTSYVRPWRVNFSIEASRVDLVFEVNERLVIGRTARYDQPFDGLDLAPFDGHELGVSRIHAIITQNNEQIVITDKGSANGTLLNEQRLEPETAYVLKHGDKIRLGNMYVHVYFLTPIFQTT